MLTSQIMKILISVSSNRCWKCFKGNHHHQLLINYYSLRNNFGIFGQVRPRFSAFFKRPPSSFVYFQNFRLRPTDLGAFDQVDSELRKIPIFKKKKLLNDFCHVY